MKRVLISITILLLAVTLFSCKVKTENLKFAYDYMHTFIAIDIKGAQVGQKEEIHDHLEEIFKSYHELATNVAPLSGDYEFKENIYTINQKPLQTLEIDEPLYRMLEKSLAYNRLTDGHFDVSIGKIIDVWKNEILDEYDGYIFQEIPEEVFNDVLVQIEKFDVIENAYTLSEEDDKFFIHINHEDVKLDLGAIAKGYATQIAADYIESLGYGNYSISAGSSSIVVGKNPDRDGNIFIISLANPLRKGTDDHSYGKVHIKDVSITTSGNFEQYAEFNGLRYHHIISPITKMPMHYYHTVTIIGQDAGLLDAISTAMLSMSPDELDLWMSLHQDELQIEVIRFNYDGTITTYLKNTELLNA